MASSLLGDDSDTTKSWAGLISTPEFSAPSMTGSVVVVISLELISFSMEATHDQERPILPLIQSGFSWNFWKKREVFENGATTP